MSAIAPTTTSPFPPGTPALHRITVDESKRITASGALEDPGRVELIDGSISTHNEPEPDLAVVRGINADYRHRRPTPDDVTLPVEVSDSTLRQDRGVKLAAYATAGIPVCWIVDLVDRRVAVCTRPVKAVRYRSRKDYEPVSESRS